VLVGVNLTITPETAPAVVAVSEPSVGLPEVGSSASDTPGITQAMVTQQDQARMAALMLAHAQNRGMNQPGLAAFTKLVTYQSQ
jgi:hypothetical protein